MLPSTDIACPYCGEVITILLDVPFDAGGPVEQHYIEDCQVCCRPISIAVTFDIDGDPIVSANAEDDAV